MILRKKVPSCEILYHLTLNLIECDIKKKSTIMRNPIPPNIKLAATLRFLSTGANYAELQHIFRIHQSTIYTRSLWDNLHEAKGYLFKGNYIVVSIYNLR